MTVAEYDIRDLRGAVLAAAVQQYAREGFVAITGVEALSAAFQAVIGAVTGFDERALASALDPASGPCRFPAEVRQRLARIETPDALARQALVALRPLLHGLIGPIAHVSSTFHAQFKGGGAPAVDHGGYGSGHLEVHGAYLLHQDFTGANRPTSPSAVTLWLPINTCPDWNLRIYPGSHRQGLLCNQWLELDDERLRPLGTPVDFTARAGRAVLFSALALHGTSHPGPARRVSCDIRFFPLCGFLPTVPYLLDGNPLQAIHDALPSTSDETLRAPLLEDQVFAGQAIETGAVRSGSILNWVRYIACVAVGRPDEAAAHLERFTNAEIGVDASAVYDAKFRGHAARRFTLPADGASV